MAIYRKKMNEDIKGWKNAHSDLAKFRKQQKDFYTHTVKKNGELSGMHDAKIYHATLDQAKDFRDRVAKLNPGSKPKAIFGKNDKGIFVRIDEDAPVNNVGGGNIAGVGVGPKGEPGVSRSAKPRILRRKEIEAGQRNQQVKSWKKDAITEGDNKMRVWVLKESLNELYGRGKLKDIEGSIIDKGQKADREGDKPGLEKAKKNWDRVGRLNKKAGDIEDMLEKKKKARRDAILHPKKKLGPDRDF